MEEQINKWFKAIIESASNGHGIRYVHVYRLDHNGEIYGLALTGQITNGFSIFTHDAVFGGEMGSSYIEAVSWLYRYLVTVSTKPLYHEGQKVYFRDEAWFVVGVIESRTAGLPDGKFLYGLQKKKGDISSTARGMFNESELSLSPASS